MADYKDSFKERSKGKNNVSEKFCENWLNVNNIKYIKFGFDQTEGNKIPTNYFFKVPVLLRNAPDYFCYREKSNIFLECKGFKGCLKIKEDDLQNYKFWNDLAPLYFFILNCSNNKHHILSYENLNSRIPFSEAEVYPDNNKKFYKILL